MVKWWKGMWGPKFGSQNSGPWAFYLCAPACCSFQLTRLTLAHLNTACKLYAVPHGNSSWKLGFIQNRSDPVMLSSYHVFILQGPTILGDQKKRSASHQHAPKESFFALRSNGNRVQSPHPAHILTRGPTKPQRVRFTFMSTTQPLQDGLIMA